MAPRYQSFDTWILEIPDFYRRSNFWPAINYLNSEDSEWALYQYPFSDHSSPVTVPSRGTYWLVWTKKVWVGTAHDPSMIPPIWTSPFTPVQDLSQSVSYSGGGESVPAHKIRIDYVPITTEDGLQTWFWDVNGTVTASAARKRDWVTHSPKTFKLVDIGQGEEPGNGGGN